MDSVDFTQSYSHTSTLIQYLFIFFKIESHFNKNTLAITYDWKVCRAKIISNE